jgi:hypothetical protein
MIPWLFLQVARYTGSRETSGNRHAVVDALRIICVRDSGGLCQHNSYNINMNIKDCVKF